jgi:hypothetical protein
MLSADGRATPRPYHRPVPIALHGGGEFLAGDEPFLDALLEAVVSARAGAPAPDRPIRAILVPTAAARGRPDLAARHGVEALEQRAGAAGWPIQAGVAAVVDAASAADPACGDLIAMADLVFFPGGDPDLIPTILRGTAVERALVAAYGRGAVVGGASAGAMAMAEWTWTPDGGVAGLGLVSGFAVFPHYDESRRRSWQAKLERMGPPELGYLGLDERTGVISDGDDWLVAGHGSAYWFEPGAVEPLIAAAGARLRLGAH